MIICSASISPRWWLWPPRRLPRRHLSDRYGTLGIGRDAEISVFEMIDGEAHLTDGHETVIAERRLVPVGCVRAGEWIRATAGLLPQPA